MRYRPEIDGLRAIAVIAVILFHAGLKTFKGGFIGVDIFFVISGYLIASTILTDLQRGHFSLIQFYERRARRILPALFLVMAVSFGLAWMWLRPDDMQDFAQSLVAVSYFVSNIWYWLEANYWEAASELKPLLHTWTLAIEAQFYLLFPVLLLLIWRWCRAWLVYLLIGIGIGSFAIAQWGAYTFPQATFYLFPSRLWELLLGAVIGIFLINQKPSYHPKFSYETTNDYVVRELAGVIGLGLIGVSILRLDETVPFPSVFALGPTLGTAMILAFASPQTLVGRLLSTPLFVNIGLLSYGAYLWHHPLFAFARHTSLTRPAPILILGLALLSFYLAYLTWRYVELPFKNSVKINRKGFFLLWLVGSLIFIEVGMAGHVTAGFSDRTIARQSTNRGFTPILTSNFGSQIEQNSVDRLVNENAIVQIPLDTVNAEFNPDWQVAAGFGLGSICDGASLMAPECRTHENPEILLWGDSFAMQLAPGILASNPDARIVQMTKSVCGPFFDVAPIAEPNYPVYWSQECLSFNQQIREWLRENAVKYAVVSSPFSQYLLPDEKVLLRNGEIVNANIDLAVQEFEKTLAELQSLGIEPIVVSPPPANGLDLGQCVARAEWMGLPQNKCDFQAAQMSPKRVSAYQFMDAIQEQYRVLRLDQLMCHNEVCQAFADNTMLYRDARHLSQAGAVLLGQKYDFYGIITGDQ